MKTALVVLSSLFFFVSLASYAQGRPGGTGGTTGGTGGTGKPTNPTMPLPGTRSNNPFPEMDHPIFLSGKVVLPDGSPVAESVTIESVCGGRRRVETYTDSHGNFSFELKKNPSGMAMQSADIGGTSNPLSSKNPGGDAFQYRNCELQASIPGFTSEVVQVAANMSSLIESTDVGRIVIHPIGGSTASVLSATSLAAPGSAKKAMDKARDFEKKNKIEDAEKSLQKAVGIYPQYAAAWIELGRLQYAKHDTAAAQHSFQQAVAADPKYASPYFELAKIEAQSAHWQNAVDLTTKMLALNSGYPGAWLIQGVSQYNLQKFDASETSARSGIKVDPDHHVPRLEHLLGLILAGKKDYVQAAEHMRAFVKYSTQPADQQEGQKVLAEIEKRSAQADLTANPPK